MKFQLFAFVLVVAGAIAMPPASDVVVVVECCIVNCQLAMGKPNQYAEIECSVYSPNQAAPTFVVVSQIRQAIQKISDGIKNAGLDPLVIEKREFVYRPVPFFVEVRAFIENLKFSGASDIRVHSLNFNLPLSRLRFDISLPRLSLSVGDSGVRGSIFNNKINGQFKGSLLIKSIRLSGEVRVNVGVISGISLRNISLNFRLLGIRSNLSLSVQELDFSESLNNLLNESIPNALEDNSDNINRFLENIVREVFNRLP